MLKELSVLEGKVAEVASLCRALRNENAHLRQQLVGIENERRNLAERMQQARTRIEQLVEQLPEAKTTEQG